MTRWRVTTATTCSRARCSYSCRAFRRSTTSVYWRAATISSCCAGRGSGRDINRHYYGRDELLAALRRPVVAKLSELIRLRNTHAAFAGTFRVADSPIPSSCCSWHNGAEFAELRDRLRAPSSSARRVATPASPREIDLQSRARRSSPHATRRGPRDERLARRDRGRRNEVRLRRRASARDPRADEDPNARARRDARGRTGILRSRDSRARRVVRTRHRERSGRSTYGVLRRPSAGCSAPRSTAGPVPTSSRRSRAGSAARSRSTRT